MSDNFLIKVQFPSHSYFSNKEHLKPFNFHLSLSASQNQALNIDPSIFHPTISLTLAFERLSHKATISFLTLGYTSTISPLWLLGNQKTYSIFFILKLILPLTFVKLRKPYFFDFYQISMHSPSHDFKTAQILPKSMPSFYRIKTHGRKGFIQKNEKITIFYKGFYGLPIQKFLSTSKKPFANHDHTRQHHFQCPNKSSFLLMFSPIGQPNARVPTITHLIDTTSIHLILFVKTVLMRQYPKLLQSITLHKSMNTSLCPNNPNSALTYGFFCEENNTFYAFQTVEEYKSFLIWLETEANQHQNPETPQTMQNDDEIMRNSELATERIMDVFNDPVFHQNVEMMELQEIDF